MITIGKQQSSLHCLMLAIAIAALSHAFAGMVSAASSPQDHLLDQLAAEPIESLVDDARRFGEPARGAMLFFEPTLNCARCHESTNAGRRLGPNLAEKRMVEWEHLAESVLAPSKKIMPGFETVQAVTLDGELVSGLLVDETEQALVLDSIKQADQPRVLNKLDLDAWKKTEASSMPAGLVNQLANRQAFLDLVSYLGALAEAGQLAADELRPPMAVMAPLPEYESHLDHAGMISSLDDQSIQRGAEIYRLRCASCHGTVAQEGSMPTSLRFSEGKFKHGGDPFTMYQTLNHGYGMMIPQRWMVPQQKYDVIHYIREKLIKPHNAEQYFDVSSQYLAGLPTGDTRGPDPVVSRPWTDMDYGPSLNNTLEVSRDGSNIAQKGIIVRLDDGPGGVESGKYWMLYEHDTLRVAAAWQGDFIDWEGIHFNGAHQRHPSITGQVQFANATGPGFARPLTNGQSTSSLADRFVDTRVTGRDGKQYGPPPRDWMHFLGMYRFGRRVILEYTVGNTRVLEMPELSFDGQGQPVFNRVLTLGNREQDLIIQVADVAGKLTALATPASGKTGPSAITVQPTTTATERSSEGREPIQFNGSASFQLPGDDFAMFEQPFSIVARLKTKSDGTLLAKTRDQSNWVQQGQSLFIRGGRPTFDIGWVGAVRADRRIDDGRWHDLVMTSKDGEIRFYIDGKAAGGGSLRAKQELSQSVIRIGKTNDNFPQSSEFDGQIDDLRFYQRAISADEIQITEKLPADWLARWNHQTESQILAFGDEATSYAAQGSSPARAPAGLLASAVASDPDVELEWLHDGEHLRLRIAAGQRVNITLAQAALSGEASAATKSFLTHQAAPRNLEPLTQGGPSNYPQSLPTELQPGDDNGPFAVDVFVRPTDNPWNCRMRLTGIDFLPDSDTAVVTSWDGSVWLVEGTQSAGESSSSNTITWRRFAYGLFQPLGVKVIDGTIHVICRDQLIALHDLNADGEADWYQNINSDHQVTEHFHEFAAGLQTDAEGNFYYAKGARHALPAVVPHHGTIIKVSADGENSEILANGFRAANGICLNPDGTFFVTDQEGHWTPKNRINLVRRGGFYGNMMGYHDGVSESDEAMEQPVCWITNSFDRSPAEMLWVDSKAWGPLNGSLLNLSYGYGQIFVVPHENVGGQTQGGMAALPIPRFPTGIMRGRFRPEDGQLYCCGMFAWAGNQQQPGGFYRVRATGKPMHLPVQLHAAQQEISITFTDPIDPESAKDLENFRIEAWDLKRTKNYGSEHHNQHPLTIKSVVVSADKKTISLSIPDLAPTRGMEIRYALKSEDGQRVSGAIHNTIH